MRKIFLVSITLLLLIFNSANAQLSINMSSVEVEQNANATVDISVTNFTDLIAVGFSINYDSTRLEFVNFTNFTNSLPGFNSANVLAPGSGPALKKGQITFLWDDSSLAGRTLGANTRLFSITFKAIGAKGTSSDVFVSSTPREVSIVNRNLVETKTVNNVRGKVTIKTDGGGPVDNCVSPTCSNANNLTLIAGTVSAEKDKTICVPITVKNFRMIQSGQGSISWNPALLQFTEVKTPTTGGLPDFASTIVTTNAPNGNIRFLWSNPTPATPLTLPDNAVIMEMCYRVLGNSGQTGCIEVGKGPLETIWDNDSGSVPLCFTYGKVNITSAPPSGAVVFRVGTINGQANETVCVDVSVEKFTKVTGATVRFGWNADQLEFVRTDNYDLEMLNSGSFNNTTNSLTMQWLGSGSSFSKVDGHKIFRICFKIKQCVASSSVNITATPDLVGEGNVQLVSQGVGGSVTCTTPVGCSATCTLGAITNVSCNGATDGSVNLTVTGTNLGAHNIVWKNASGTVVKASAPVTSGTNLSGVAAGVYTYEVTLNNTMCCTGTATVNQPSAITIPTANVITNAQCDAKGSIDLRGVAGGNGGFTYAWSPDQGNNANPTNLNAGTYTVTVTDSKGCKATNTFTIVNVPSQIVIPSTGVITNAQCDAKGAIDLRGVSGGTTPYSYAWSPDQGNNANPTNLDAGTYTVTVTDSKGCKATNTFTIVNTPSQIVIPSTGVVTNAQCDAKGAIDLRGVTGGTTPYTYAWSPDQGNNANPVNLNAGTYTVTVTDAKGCKATSTFTITNVMAQIVIPSTGVVTNAQCEEKGAIDLKGVSGGSTPYTYAWSPDQGNNANPVNLNAGTYTVTVTDSKGCKATSTFTVTNVMAQIVIPSTGVVTNAQCEEKGAIDIKGVSGGSTPYTYAWSPDQGNIANPVNLNAGTYTVTVTDAKGCKATSTFNILNIPSQINIPNAGVVTNEGCGVKGSINITTTSGGNGTLTYSWNPNLGNTGNPTNLNEGTYTVTVTDSKKCTATASFTVGKNITELNVTSTVKNVKCKGGSDGEIQINITGGCPTITYTWTGGLTGANPKNLRAGTYTVTVGDGSQNKIHIVSVTEPNDLSITLIGTIDATSAVSTDGKITLSISGGTSPYRALWAGPTTIPDGNTTGALEANNLRIGSYGLTVTDANGCTAARTGINIAIRPPEVLAPKIGSADVSSIFNGFGVSCFGDANGAITAKLSEGTFPITATLKAGATTVRNVQISNPDVNFTGLAAGTYVIEFTNSRGTVISPPIIITQPTKLAAIEKVDCTDKGKSTGKIEIVMNNTGAGNYGFVWDGSNDTDNVLENLATGFYNVRITDANRCELRLTNIEVKDCKIVGDCFTGSKVITPNGDGKNDLFEINCLDSNNADLSVFDRWGKQVYFETNYKNTWQGTNADNTPLKEGSYIWVLNVNYGQGVRDVFKGTVTILTNN